MASRIQNILKNLRNTGSDDPAYRVSEPFRTPASITVLPETGGIFCVNGRDTLELGKSIAKDCEWDVYYVAYKGAPAVKIDTTMWEILTPEPTVPCVVMVDILANVDGKPYRTTRPISFMNVEGGDVDVPIQFVTNPLLPGAYVGQKYKAYIGAKMGTAFTGLEWGLSEGAPEWLTLEPAASVDGIQRVAVVGIPTEFWEGTITVTATATGSSNDENPSETLECYIIAVPALPPRILTRDLGAWEVGRYREVSITSTIMDGTTDMTWDVTPRLPNGLSLDSKTGVISGVPDPVDEEYSAEHTVTLHAFGHSVSAKYDVSVYPALQITSPAYLPDLVYGSSYEVRLDVQGAMGPFAPRWLSFSPSTPQGLHLTEDGKLHTVSGEPAIELGEYQFRVGVIDGLCRGATKLLTLECVPETHFVSRALVSGVMGREYRVTIHSTGTSGITLVSGSLPTGLTLVSSETSSMGTISGIPLFSGTFDFTLGIGDGEERYTRAFSIVIHEPPMIREGVSLPTAMQNTAYSHVISASGTPSLKYATVTPSLPAGLSVNPTTGRITGVPEESGMYPTGLSVLSPYGRDRANPVIRIRDGVSITTKSPLPTAKSGTAYSAQMEATGMEEGDEWGALWLPAGLTIDAKTGLISGTPTAPETDVRDCIVSITVFTPEGAVFLENFVMGLNTTPTPTPTPTKILPETLPPAYTGVKYSVSLSYHADESEVVPVLHDEESTIEPEPEKEPVVEPEPGEDSVVEPVTWSSSPLPAGLTLNPETGVISGTISEMPTEEECKFEITAKNGDTVLASREYTLSVIESTVITTESLRDGKDGAKYGPVTLEHTGPISEGFVWQLFSTAPSWLTIDPETGKISSGDATAVYRADGYQVPVIIAKLDEDGNIVDALTYKVLPLRITKDPVIAPDSLPTAVCGVNYEGVKLTVDPPKPEDYVWELERAEDAKWLVIDRETGELSGTPPQTYESETTIPFKAAVMENKMLSRLTYAEKQFSLKVNPGSGPKIVTDILPTDHALPTARVGVPYSLDFRVENPPAGVDSWVWHLSGLDDTGLVLDTKTGSLRGTPDTEFHEFLPIVSIKKTETDTEPFALRGYTLSVKPAPAIIDSDPLPQVYPDLDEDYSYEFHSKGVDEGAVWTVTGLPDGLTFDSTGHSIKGSIPAQADYAIHHHFVTVHVQNPDKTEVERVFSLYTGPAARMAVNTLPPANVGTAYPETKLCVIGKDGVIDDGWGVRCSNLPSGLTIEGMVLQGTLGEFGGSGPKEYRLIMTLVKDSITTDQPIPLSCMNTSIMQWGAIATAPTLPPIPVGETRTYAIELTPIPEIKGAVWSIADSETVTAHTAKIEKTGQFTADLTITANDTTPVIVVVKCTFGRTDKGAETITAELEFHAVVIGPSSAPTIITESLPPAYEGLEYNTTLKYACTDTETPVEWSVSADTPLPAGLTLDSETGVLSGWVGREVTGKTYPVTVTVKHKFGVDTKPLEIVVGSETEGPVRLRERSLPQPVAGERYSAMITVLGDRSNVGHVVAIGLPSSLSYTDGLPVGVISGDADDDRERTTFTVKITVQDQGDLPMFSREFDLSWEAVGLEFVSLPDGTFGFPYYHQLIKTGFADDMTIESSELKTGANMQLVRDDRWPGSCWVQSAAPNEYDGPVVITVKLNGVTVKTHRIEHFVVKRQTQE